MVDQKKQQAQRKNIAQPQKAPLYKSNTANAMGQKKNPAKKTGW